MSYCEIKDRGLHKAIALCLLSMLIGCTSYKPGMTVEEKVIARYEQNCGSEHLCKHVFVDLISLGFGEFWYHRVRSTYGEVMEQRKRAAEEESRWRQFISSFKGRSKSEIIQECGVPDKEFSDGDGGVLLMYETSLRSGWMSSSGDAHRFFNGDTTFYSSYSNWSDNAYVRQLWFVIGADGKCTNVKKKMLTRAAGN